VCFIVRELKSGFPKLRETLIRAVTRCYWVSRPPPVFAKLQRGVRFQIERKPKNFGLTGEFRSGRRQIFERSSMK